MNKFYTKGWNVAYKRKDENIYHVIKNNFGSWVADPFIVEHDNRVYIFGEMYTYDRYKGSIAYCELINGKATKWKKIISEEYHLSFPNIYKEDNEFYMYAESSDGKNFYRYKAISFPTTWVKDIVYQENVEIVDTVLFDYNGKKYGFTYNIQDSKNELLLFTIEHNNIIYYKNNPISTDISVARPGGKVIIKDNKYIRVSQNCINEYGGGLVFSEFMIKDGLYKENIIKRIDVNDIKYDYGKWIGVHTYNESNDYSVIDLKFKSIVISSILIRIINKIRRFFK